MISLQKYASLDYLYFDVLYDKVNIKFLKISLKLILDI